MEPITISWILNGVLLVLGYFMKQTHAGFKEDISKLNNEINIVKEKYFKKEDFIDFKQELWKRFDRLEDDVKNRIEELKK